MKITNLLTLVFLLNISGYIQAIGTNNNNNNNLELNSTSYLHDLPKELLADIEQRLLLPQDETIEDVLKRKEYFDKELDKFKPYYSNEINSLSFNEKELDSLICSIIKTHSPNSEEALEKFIKTLEAEKIIYYLAMHNPKIITIINKWITHISSNLINAIKATKTNSNNVADYNTLARLEPSIASLTKYSPIRILRKALNAHDNPKLQKKYMYKAFIIAALKKNIELVKVFINCGLDVNKNKYGKHSLTPLMAASMTGSINIAKLIIKVGADINIKNNWGHTALMKACKNGHLDIVKLLIKTGADINIKNDIGYTALMESCRNRNIYSANGHLDIVKLLIKAGADINIKNNWGYTALMEACKNGHLDIGKLLIKTNENEKLLADNELLTNEELSTEELLVDNELLTNEELSTEELLVDNELLTNEELSTEELLVDNELLTDEELSTEELLVDNELLTDEELDTEAYYSRYTKCTIL